MTRPGGLILCGGESRRMGRDKASLPFEGEPLLGRVVRRLATSCAPLVVVAAAEQVLPPLPEEVAVARDRASGRGPMEGLAVGLAALRGRAEAAFVTSTDAPFVVPAFVARLHALLGDRAICAPAIGGRRHPLGAIYRVSLADDVAARAARGEGRLQDLLDTHPTRLVTAEELLADEALRRADPTLTSLDNLNTPADYQRALASDR